MSSKEVTIASEILDVIGKHKLGVNESKEILQLTERMVNNIVKLSKVFDKPLYEYDNNGNKYRDLDSSCGE